MGAFPVFPVSFYLPGVIDFIQVPSPLDAPFTQQLSVNGGVIVINTQPLFKVISLIINVAHLFLYIDGDVFLPSCL